MIDVKELKENHPEFALLLENDGNRPPHFSKLNYTRIPVQDLQVDSYILVRAGEVCKHYILCIKLLKTTLFCFKQVGILPSFITWALYLHPSPVAFCVMQMIVNFNIIIMRKGAMNCLQIWS